MASGKFGLWVDFNQGLGCQGAAWEKLLEDALVGFVLVGDLLLRLWVLVDLVMREEALVRVGLLGEVFGDFHAF